MSKDLEKLIKEATEEVIDDEGIALCRKTLIRNLKDYYSGRTPTYEEILKTTKLFAEDLVYHDADFVEDIAQEFSKFIDKYVKTRNVRDTRSKESKLSQKTDINKLIKEAVLESMGLKSIDDKINGFVATLKTQVDLVDESITKLNDDFVMNLRRAMTGIEESTGKEIKEEALVDYLNSLSSIGQEIMTRVNDLVHAASNLPSSCENVSNFLKQLM